MGNVFFLLLNNSFSTIFEYFARCSCRLHKLNLTLKDASKPDTEFHELCKKVFNA
jgi:hypothetical protein